MHREVVRPEVDVHDYTKVRIGENQSTFREANEGIELAAERMALFGPIPFLCECPREGCTELLRLTLDEYEDIRSNPQRFVTVPGHEDVAIETGAGKLVERREGYVIVDKIGVAGTIARERYEQLSG